jgi:hypothetical protein
MSDKKMKTDQCWLMLKLPHADSPQEAAFCPECGAALEQAMPSTENDGVKSHYYVCMNEGCKNRPYFGIIFTDNVDPDTAA